MKTRRVYGAALAVLLCQAAPANGGFNCGDGIVGLQESCDDGNTITGDGCSEFCQIEDGYECTTGFIPTGNNVVDDPGFEEGGGAWPGFSTSGAPVICTTNDCPEGFFARDGAHWAQFGDFGFTNTSVITQDVIIPTTHRYIEFDLALPSCGTSEDELFLVIDNIERVRYDGTDEDCGVQGYRRERFDLEAITFPAVNDGDAHAIRFVSAADQGGNQPTFFLIDNVAIVEQIDEARPSFCELADRTLDFQDFDPGVAGDLGALGLTTFELGDPIPWGTTDDGICGTGEVPLGNVTGGLGEAACLDATANGSDNIVSVFCTSAIDFSTVLGAQLSFLANVQLGQNTSGDVFGVLIGIEPPDESTIFNYIDAFVADGNIGEFGAPPGELITVDLSPLNGEPQGYACFVFGAETAFYAQVDTINISGQDCTDDLDEDKLLGCFDNCTEKFNPDQTDSDGDGYGNACDADINRLTLPGGRAAASNANDCIVNVADLGALRQAFFSRPTDVNWNPDADFNNDSVVNIEDLGIMRQSFFGSPGPSSTTAVCQAPAP